MHKISVSLRVVVMIVATALVVAGCMNPMQGSSSAASGDSGTGSLSINVGTGIGALTWQPSEDDRTPVDYVITGIGPAGARFDDIISVNGGTLDVPALRTGDWLIEVDALNKNEVVVAQGTASARVAAGSATPVEITVRPVDGNGVLDILIDWGQALNAFRPVENAAGSVTATGTLSRYTGSGFAVEETPTVAKTVTDPDNNIWSVEESIPAGYYRFDFVLKNGDRLVVPPISRAVRIMGDGLRTVGRRLLSEEDVNKQGQINLAITLDMENPLDLTIAADGRTNVAPGESLTLAIGGIPEGIDVEYLWRLGNQDIPGETGATITLDYDDFFSDGDTYGSVTAFVAYRNTISSITFQVNVMTPDHTVFPTQSIQDAIDRAESGDVIEVLAGTYNENITINKNITLIGEDAQTVIIDGVQTGSQLGTVQLTPGRSGVVIQNLHIKGLDGPTAGLEKSAIYVQGGGHSNITIKDNIIEARGDSALLGEWNSTIDGMTITNNLFIGQTFIGEEPATGNQFEVPNVARQAIAFGGGAGTTNTRNFVFTGNVIEANAALAMGVGNTLVTLDLVGTNLISDNVFSGRTGGSALRVRGSGVYKIEGNDFTNGLYDTAIFTQASNLSNGVLNIADFLENKNDVGSANVVDGRSDDERLGVIPNAFSDGSVKVYDFRSREVVTIGGDSVTTFTALKPDGNPELGLTRQRGIMTAVFEAARGERFGNTPLQQVFNAEVTWQKVNEVFNANPLTVEDVDKFHAGMVAISDASGGEHSEFFVQVDEVYQQFTALSPGAQEMIVAAVTDTLAGDPARFRRGDIWASIKSTLSYMFGMTPNEDAGFSLTNEGATTNPPGTRPFYYSFWSFTTASVQKLDTVESFWFILKSNNENTLAPWLTIYTYPVDDMDNGFGDREQWFGSRVHHYVDPNNFAQTPTLYYVGDKPDVEGLGFKDIVAVELTPGTGSKITPEKLQDETPNPLRHENDGVIKALTLGSNSGQTGDYNFTMIASGFRMTGDGIVVEESFDYRNLSADPEL